MYDYECTKFFIHVIFILIINETNLNKKLVYANVHLIIKNNNNQKVFSNSIYSQITFLFPRLVDAIF